MADADALLKKFRSSSRRSKVCEHKWRRSSSEAKTVIQCIKAMYEVPECDRSKSSAISGVVIKTVSDNSTSKKRKNDSRNTAETEEQYETAEAKKIRKSFEHLQKVGFLKSGVTIEFYFEKHEVGEMQVLEEDCDKKLRNIFVPGEESEKE